MNFSRHEDLVRKANRFYLRYGSEVENLRRLVEVNLTQLCIAYTINNQLPRSYLCTNARERLEIDDLGPLKIVEDVVAL
jgi:hypothetical protein